MEIEVKQSYGKHVEVSADTGHAKITENVNDITEARNMLFNAFDETFNDYATFHEYLLNRLGYDTCIELGEMAKEES